LTWGNGRKPGCDDGLAQLEDHVFERGFGLGPVPGLGGGPVGDVGGVVPVQGVPGDDHRLDDHAERDGAFDGSGQPVAGLPDAGLLLAVGVGWLD